MLLVMIDSLIPVHIHPFLSYQCFEGILSESFIKMVSETACPELRKVKLNICIS